MGDINPILEALEKRGRSRIQLQSALDEWAKKLGLSANDASEAMSAIPIASVPIAWGAKPFDELWRRLAEVIRRANKSKLFHLHQPTTKYEIFSWGYELIPSLGIFPLFLTKERSASWTVLEIGKQRRLALLFSKEIETSIKDWISPTTEDSLQKVTVTQFEELISYFRTNPALRANFFYFGPGHIAARILALAMSNMANQQYFLYTLDHYRTLLRVNASRCQAAFAIANGKKLRQGGGFSEKFENHFSNPKEWHAASSKVAEAGMNGLVQELRRGDVFRFVVSDMGVAEFLYLKSREDLTIWQIEHNEEIPVGIGLSLPSLIKLSSCKNVFDSLTEVIDQWLFENREQADSVLSEYGIELTLPRIQGMAEKSEVESFLIRVRDYCSTGLRGHRGGDTPIVKDAKAILMKWKSADGQTLSGMSTVTKDDLNRAQRLLEMMKASELAPQKQNNFNDELHNIIKKWIH